MKYLECLNCNTPMPLGTRERISFSTRCGTCTPSNTDMVIRRSVFTLSAEAKMRLTETAIQHYRDMVELYEMDPSACVDQYISERGSLDAEKEDLYND